MYGLRCPKLDQSVVVLQFVFEKVDVMWVGMEEKNVKTYFRRSGDDVKQDH